MTKITFVSADGARTTVDATDGSSVMQTALDNAIDGIQAECGGAMACATCHVYVDPAFAANTGSAGEHEAEMLEFAACEVKPTSRLSCQIKVSQDLDGLTVHLPERQT
jgi:2Fe-2S ferredoxin